MGGAGRGVAAAGRHTAGASAVKPTAAVPANVMGE